MKIEEIWNSGVWKKLEIYEKFEMGWCVWMWKWTSKCEFDDTSVSRSDEEMEEIVGDDGGGTNSVAGSNIAVLWFVMSEDQMRF